MDFCELGLATIHDWDTPARAQRHHIRMAILKQGSPPCGSTYIYDGSFSGNKAPNAGATTALLRQAGIHVFGEDQLEEANLMLRRLEAEATKTSSF